MNCTKEYSNELVEKYWKREWSRIKEIDFPMTRQYNITDKECSTELVNLRDDIRNNKAASKTIVRFHPSLRYANRRKCLSPYDYWQYIKQDENEFKKFYENRLRCSDWFKEKKGANMKYLHEGFVPEFIYGIGMSTSRKAPFVSYFKPALAKNIILKYLDYDTIFDPCAGYSGRMLGALCAGRNFIGYDLNYITIMESKDLYHFVQPLFHNKVELQVEDSLNVKGKFDCLFTCTPYKDIEEWQTPSGKISSNLSCDEWITKLLDNFDCKKYIFVVDDSIKQYNKYIVEELENTSHFGKNKEYIIEISK
jgi:hypothetical protein